jgi:hypothetical protein
VRLERSPALRLGSERRHAVARAGSGKAWLFAGSQAGAERFADLLSLVSTADAAGVNPGAYIADILPRIDCRPPGHAARGFGGAAIYRRADCQR